MPRSKFGKKRDPIDSESMKKAIEAVTASPTKRISIREACKVFNVKFATVVRHLKAFKDSGGKNFEYKVKYDVKKVFTDEEENKLIEYITTVAKMNYGLTKKGVRELAFKFAVANKKKIPLTWNENRLAGEEWMRLFLKRYSEAVAMRKPEKTSLSRATSFNQTNVDRFFDNLEDVHKRFGPFPPNRIWNQDETGITTVQNPSKIVAPKGAKQVGAVTSSERGQLITLSTCVSATGNHIPPMMIFPRVHFKDFMLKGAPPGTIGGASPSGWSNETLYYMFMNHFIQQTKPTLDERVLLIIDNHESHLDIDTLDLASKAGVVIVTFPPHTSHKLQPLDVSVYFPFKAYYNQGVEAWLLNNPGKTFNIYCAAEIVGEAYPRAFTTINITKGFEKTGIYPLKRNIFNEDDFLPSSVTDRPAPPTAVTEVADHELPCTSSQIVRSPSCSGEDTGPSTSAFSPLTPVHSAECTTDYSNVCLVSPEEIQPYPKAEARKAVRKGRKPGRTKVATDTPEKEEIRNQKENKKLKKIIAEQKGSKKINKSNQTKKKRGRSIKKLHFESDSDSEEDVDISSHDEDELSELIDIINREELEMREEEDFERETFEEEDYVLVIFTKKKGPPDHYVAKIISKDQDGLEYQVMYYKRIGTSSKFIKESEEVFDVVREDIVVKLPKPIELEGSARIQGQLWFQIDFSNYNLK